MQGSCLCGAVRYQITQLDGPIAHCSCHTCRKAHAAAFTSTARVLRAHFRWSAGAEALRAFESSPGKLRHFCGNCGSHLMAERAGQQHVIVRVATLDHDPGQAPQFHIWTSHQQPWLAYGAPVPAYPEWQPGR